MPNSRNLVDCPFYGIRFYNESMSRHGTYSERKPSGYLTLRSKFDHGLANIAVKAGAVMHQGVRAIRIEEDTNGVRAELSDGTTVNAQLPSRSRWFEQSDRPMVGTAQELESQSVCALCE